MATPRQNDFQVFLEREMDTRGWSQARLAREAGIFKGTVGRWLRPEGHPQHRTPNMDSFITLGELFGVDPLRLMRMAGINLEDDGSASRIKRDVVAVVMALPDDYLITVYPQLRALLDSHVQQEIQSRRSEASVASRASQGE